MTLIRLRSRAALVALLLAVASAPVAAQTAQTTPASGAPPKPACTKPDEFPGNLVSDRMKNNWLKEVNAYLACMKKFVDDQNAIAQTHINAANAAIAEHNAVAKSAQAVVKKPDE